MEIRDVTIYHKTVYRDMKRPRMSTVRFFHVIPCRGIAARLHGKCAL